jgi:hypothetical protein
MSMKYRQRGYRDSEHQERTRQKPPPSKPLTPEEKAQQRALKHAVAREANEVVRCPNCGRNAQAFGAITSDTVCPYCAAALHCCRACRHFDTSARWECRQPEIPERVADKGKANSCAFFEARLVLDATGKRTGSGPASNDPKSQFENLFKR